MNAVCLGDEEMVKSMLEADTNADIKNGLGQTTLRISENTGQTEILRILKEAGALEQPIVGAVGHIDAWK